MLGLSHTAVMKGLESDQQPPRLASPEQVTSLLPAGEDGTPGENWTHT